MSAGAKSIAKYVAEKLKKLKKENGTYLVWPGKHNIYSAKQNK